MNLVESLLTFCHYKFNYNLLMLNQTIVNKIIEHVKDRGGLYSSWYIGIASNPRDRLFSDHNVSEKNGCWIFRNAQTERSARAIEEHLLKLGFDGGNGGGDTNTTYVYVYKKTTTTEE